MQSIAEFSGLKIPSGRREGVSDPYVLTQLIETSTNIVTIGYIHYYQGIDAVPHTETRAIRFRGAGHHGTRVELHRKAPFKICNM